VPFEQVGESLWLSVILQVEPDAEVVQRHLSFVMAMCQTIELRKVRQAWEQRSQMRLCVSVEVSLAAEALKVSEHDQRHYPERRCCLCHIV